MATGLVPWLPSGIGAAAVPEARLTGTTVPPVGSVTKAVEPSGVMATASAELVPSGIGVPGASVAVAIGSRAPLLVVNGL